MKSILWANIVWNHMGKYSGLTPLSREVAAYWGDGFERIETTERSPTLFTKASHRLKTLSRWSVKNPEWNVIKERWSPFYSEKAYILERAISKLVSQNAPDFVILESIEDQFFLLAQERKSWPATRLVGIAHQPPAWWRLHHGRPDIVGSLDLLIIVAEGMRTFWEQFIDPEKIIFLPVGVDINFFSPSDPVPEKLHQSLQVVFSGLWLRDFETLSQVVNIADRQSLDVTFDLIVPRHARDGDAFYQMAKSPRVSWHSNLSDDGLRSMYQEADIFLLTLIDATANCSLLEAMACGIPAIVTDVGGVRDYANEKFVDFVAPRDAPGIVALLKNYITDKRQLLPRAAAARSHVEQNLSWELVAKDLVSALTKTNHVVTER